MSVPKSALKMVWRTTPSPFEARYPMIRSSAASIMLKRRNEKSSPPGRKLLRLKLKALLNTGMRCLEGLSFGVSAVDSSNWGSTMVAVAIIVDSFTEFSVSCEIVGLSSYDSGYRQVFNHYSSHLI